MAHSIQTVSHIPQVSEWAADDARGVSVAVCDSRLENVKKEKLNGKHTLKVEKITSGVFSFLNV